MKKQSEFQKRIDFIYKYFEKKHSKFGVSKPTKASFTVFLGISRGKLQSWENGSWPKDEDLQSISRKMGFSFAWLAFGTGEPFDAQDTPPVQSVAPDGILSGQGIDPLRRMTRAIGIPEDPWSVSDYLGIPVADASDHIQQVRAARQSQPPQSLPLPELWREAARRRYGITPAWLDSGCGRSHEARADEEPQALRTLRGMVDMLTAHGGTNEQVQELILNYGRAGADGGAESREAGAKPDPAKHVFL